MARATWHSLRPPQPVERSGRQAGGPAEPAALRGRKLSGRQLEQAHGSPTQLSRTLVRCQAVSGSPALLQASEVLHHWQHFKCSTQGSQAFRAPQRQLISCSRGAPCMRSPVRARSRSQITAFEAAETAARLARARTHAVSKHSQPARPTHQGKVSSRVAAKDHTPSAAIRAAAHLDNLLDRRVAIRLSI